MKKYPKIPRTIITGSYMYAFDKLDGSNIRAEWSKKKGFYKFGSRKRMLGEDDKLLGEAISLIQEKYGESLPKIFVKERWQKVICFFEFYGPNSFAGTHQDEPHDVVLFDVAHDNKGIIEPKEFIKIFSTVDTTKLLYTGNINSDFISSVREGKLEGMTFEGVVCKGKINKPGLPLMFKLKNQEWVDKLHIKCAGDNKLLEEFL